MGYAGIKMSLWGKLISFKCSPEWNLRAGEIV